MLVGWAPLTLYSVGCLGVVHNINRERHRAQYGDREVSSLQTFEKFDHLWQRYTHPPPHRIYSRCKVETSRKIRLLSWLCGPLLPSGRDAPVVQHRTTHHRKCPHTDRYHHYDNVTANLHYISGAVFVVGFERSRTYGEIFLRNRCCGRGLARAGLVTFVSCLLASVVTKLPLINRMVNWLPLVKHVVEATTEEKLLQVSKCGRCQS